MPAGDSEIVQHLKRKLSESTVEVERMKHEMLGMARELEESANRVRFLEHRQQHSPPRVVQVPSMSSEMEQALRRETETMR